LALPPGTVLVGDFQRAVVWDRELASISIGTNGDDFLCNMVRLPAELRCAFGTLRSAAFVDVTLGA